MLTKEDSKDILQNALERTAFKILLHWYFPKKNCVLIFSVRVLLITNLSTKRIFNTVHDFHSLRPGNIRL